MNEANYGKCGDLSVIWEYSKKKCSWLSKCSEFHYYDLSLIGIIEFPVTHMN